MVTSELSDLYQRKIEVAYFSNAFLKPGNSSSLGHWLGPRSLQYNFEKSLPVWWPLPCFWNMTGSSVAKSNCSLKSRLPCVVSSANPLYPRKCGELSLDSFDLLRSERLKSAGARLANSEIVSSGTPWFVMYRNPTLNRASRNWPSSNPRRSGSSEILRSRTGIVIAFWVPMLVLFAFLFQLLKVCKTPGNLYLVGLIPGQRIAISGCAKCSATIAFFFGPRCARIDLQAKLLNTIPGI